MYDFVQSIESIQQPPIEHLMFIAESALISEIVDAASMSLALLELFNPPGEIEAWLDLINHLSTFLEQHNRLTPEGQEFIQRVNSRYHEEVPEDDF
jgi:hypothetical protein